MTEEEGKSWVDAFPGRIAGPDIVLVRTRFPFLYATRRLTHFKPFGWYVEKRA